MFALMMTPLVFTSCDDSTDEENVPKEGDKELMGTIADVKNLDATVEYLLTGPVIVADGGKLNIPAGTVIKAEQGFDKYILVLRG